MDNEHMSTTKHTFELPPGRSYVHPAALGTELTKHGDAYVEDSKDLQDLLAGGRVLKAHLDQMISRALADPAEVPACLAGPGHIAVRVIEQHDFSVDADPVVHVEWCPARDAELIREAIDHDLRAEYAKRVTAKLDELLGDLDNWKPTGFLGARP
jgi:hypothetical protein